MAQSILMILSLVCMNLMIINAKLTCKNEKNEPIDYYIGYKIPKLEKSSDNSIKNGLKYMYIDSLSHSKSWLNGQRLLNDDRSILGATIRPLYKQQSSNYNMIVYNDQKPTLTTRSSSVGAHSKGIVAFDGKSGFWLIHSIPKFPNFSENNYDYPKNSLNNGQIFMCISLSTNDHRTMQSIVEHLKHIRANIYDINFTKTFLRNHPIFNEISVNKRGKNRKSNATIPLVQTIKSLNNQELKLFAKNQKFVYDIYADVLARYFEIDFFTQTWRNGAGEILPSDCTFGYKVFNVDTIKIPETSIQWPYREDHSKWSISLDPSKKPVVCIGDLNRMRSQFNRGGGAICIQSLHIWNLFKSIIYDIEGCPANKVRYPGSDWLLSFKDRSWRKIDDSKQS